MAEQENDMCRGYEWSPPRSSDEDNLPLVSVEEKYQRILENYFPVISVKEHLSLQPDITMKESSD